VKVGIFVGSFNPPTKAHLEIGKYLYQKRILDKIIYVPVNNKEKDLISLFHRINMLKIMLKDYSCFSVSSIMEEIKSNFNYNILKYFEKEYDDIYIIMGSDLFLKFNSFDNKEEMLNKYHFIIVPRDNIDINNIINDNYFKYLFKFRIIDYYNNISSSLVRENLKKKMMITKSLDDKVYDYILQEKLYQDE